MERLARHPQLICGELKQLLLHILLTATSFARWGLIRASKVNTMYHVELHL